ncbi:hypothetical protein Afe04nite_20510 [Asanoa ferruginea]|nr:hypothetical protein Afe04nite_20510 [Asanoa ferruginea]
MYRQHRGAIERYVRRRAVDLDCDDVVAKVMATAWQRFDTVPEDNPLPWLYITARNVLANEIRDHRNDRHDPHDPAGSLFAGIPEQRDDAAGVVDRDVLRQAIAELPEPDCEILRLIAFEELTVPEVATVLGMRRTAVYNRVARLRALWDGHSDDPPKRIYQIVPLLGRRRSR